jgi:branched-chain amino acid transport system permease protein
MGVPLVKTKLLAYGVGATFGGIAGVFLALFTSILNPNTFQFGISIIILGMVILGGLGSIWGVALGAALLSLVNTWVLPDVLDKPGIHQDFLDLLGLEFSFAEVKYGIFGFILLLMMVLRPEGLIPERRHKMELRDTEGGGPVAGATSVYEARA